jgi:hypothetical protein
LRKGLSMLPRLALNSQSSRQKQDNGVCMVGNIYNPSTWEVDVDGL